MSTMRERVLLSAEKDRAARERVHALVNGDAADATPDALDAAHFRDPLSARKPLLHPLTPYELGLTLLGAAAGDEGVQRGVVAACKDDNFGAQDALALAASAAPRLVRPVAKSLAQGFLLRALERAAEVWASDGSDVDRGRWSRGARGGRRAGARARGRCAALTPLASPPLPSAQTSTTRR